MTGDVIDGSEPAALARAIVRLLDDPARRHEMGLAARGHATTYDLASAVRATWHIYRGVMRDRVTAIEAAS